MGMMKTGMNLHDRDVWARRVAMILTEAPSEAGVKAASDLLSQGNQFRRTLGNELEPTWFLGHQEVGLSSLCYRLDAWMSQPYTLAQEYGKKAKSGEDLT